MTISAPPRPAPAPTAPGGPPRPRPRALVNPLTLSPAEALRVLALADSCRFWRGTAVLFAVLLLAVLIERRLTPIPQCNVSQAVAEVRR